MSVRDARHSIYIHSVRSAQSRDVSGSVDCKGEIKTSRHAKTGS